MNVLSGAAPLDCSSPRAAAFGGIAKDPGHSTLFKPQFSLPPSFTSGRLDEGKGISFNPTCQSAPERPRTPASTTVNLSAGVVATSIADDGKEDSAHGQHSHEEPEEYEPKVNFKPIVENLPELIEICTGEENEERRFNERARLFRLDKANKEWKARGVGELRILADKTSNRCRLVMRRDQIKKLCANHIVVAPLTIKAHDQNPKACVWAAKDFVASDEQLAGEEQANSGTDEVFMAQFKTKELAGQFMQVFRDCVSMSESTATRVAEKPVVALLTAVTKPETHVDPLLSKFMPKPGSWDCAVCCLTQAADVVVCPACQTLKPGASPPAVTAASSGAVFSFGSNNQKPLGFGSLTTATTTASSSFSFLTSASTESASAFKFGTSSEPKTSSVFTTPFAFGTTSKTLGVNLVTPPAKPDAPEAKSTTLEKPNSGIFNTLSLTQEPKSIEPFSFCFNFPKDVASGAVPADTSASTPRESALEADDGEVEQVDEDRLNFSPVLTELPAEVTVLTGPEGTTL